MTHRREVGDLEFGRLLVEWKGAEHAAWLLGGAMLWLLAGAKRPQDLPARGLMSRSAAYRLAKDAREFVEWLHAEKGVNLGGELQAVEQLGRLAVTPEQEVQP
jgi:hypothetical protein